MRVKLLREEDGASLLLVYPSTLSEYGEELEALRCPAATAGSSGPTPGEAGRRPAHAACVVTTAAQRERWDLPDLAASGRAPMVDGGRGRGVRTAP